MNNFKQLRKSWGRGGAASSSHGSSDSILNRHNFRRKDKIITDEKKSILSRFMRRLFFFQPKPQKLVGQLPDGLKGFFEPIVARRSVSKTASPVENLSNSEYTPTTEREWNYLMTEPIFTENGFLRRPPHSDRRNIAAAIDSYNQQAPSFNTLSVSHFKKQIEGSFEKRSQERSTQAGTVEGMYKGPYLDL